MSVHDAEPGDIYADENGKLWRIITICHEPTVDAEEVEGTLFDPNAPQAPFAAAGGAMAQLQGFVARATINKRRVAGATSGLMWNGWKRIWRNDWRSKQPPMPTEEPAPVENT